MDKVYSPSIFKFSTIFGSSANRSSSVTSFWYRNLLLYCWYV